MEEARPSRTALRVALRRAAHQIYDDPPLIFQDPLAVKILGSEFEDELRKTETKLHKPFSVALRAFLVARSRYAEDCVSRAVESGVRQYCLLGAGLDTFAYRYTGDKLRIFEVDHPATQAWKRLLLQRNGIAVPERLTFVPVDFERESLSERLAAAGFDAAVPSFFGCLGVVPYLTADAFRGTIELVQRFPAGGGVVMDYGRPREALPPVEQMAHDSLASRVALAGEPFQLFFREEEMARELVGFRRTEDLGRDELNQRYFQGRSDQLCVKGTAARIVSAWI